MIRRLSELAQLVDGTLGSVDLQIGGAAPVSRAGATDVTFATSAQLLKESLTSAAAAVIVSGDLAQTEISKPSIVVADAEAAFIRIVELFRPNIVRRTTGISPQATICPTAVLADDVVVHPGAVIMSGVNIAAKTVIYPGVTIMENCRIGSDVQIFPQSTLYENTQVGDRCILHAGSVLGAYGFGYKSRQGKHILSAQLGNVVLGDDVEIGANTTIDRGTFDSTTVGDGTKIDDQVMVGHNCQIGKHNLLCSQVGIAGSSTTGAHVVMGGQVGVADHIDIGSKISIGAGSGVIQHVEDGQNMLGTPARPAREAMTIMASQAKVPAIRKELRTLTRQVQQLLEATEKTRSVEPDHSDSDTPPAQPGQIEARQSKSAA